jgi:hypothetical protein
MTAGAGTVGRMASLDSRTQGAIEQLLGSLRDWALADVRRAFEGGAKVGAFILAAHVIDTLAGLVKEKGRGADAWTQFVSRYLPRYDGEARLLEDGYRNATSHNYSARGIRFVDGAEYAPRHWTVESGERVLHFETFLTDLEDAYDLFGRDLVRDEKLRNRVLERARLNPPLGIVHEPVPPSLAQMIAEAHAGATSFAPSAMSASAASFPTHVELPSRPSPVPPPRRGVPRTRTRKRKKKPQ